MQVKQVDIKKLKASEYNPRQANEKEYKDLENSIREFGVVDPIIVNSAPARRNIIIGGHFRVKVCRGMGITEVPVVYVNIPKIKKEQELNLRLNKNLGQWDWDLLANFDEELLKGIGFESQELDKIFDLDLGKDADEVPEVRKKVNIKCGDLFKLGNHRLLCGDATKKEDVEKLMNGKKADMVFTDPPYGINILKGKRGRIGLSQEYEPVRGDDKPFDPLFILDMNIKPTILWGANFYASKLPIGTHWLVWDKKANIGDDTNTFSDCELVWTNVNRVSVKIYRHLYSGFLRDEDRIHPTQKPVVVCGQMIKDYGKNGDIILDLFGGSGSTLIACEQLNRICYMMEIEAIYCDVIVRRWEKFTEKKARKLN